MKKTLAWAIYTKRGRLVELFAQKKKANRFLWITQIHGNKLGYHAVRVTVTEVAE